PLPDGAVLVVGTRCAWTPDGVVPNAALYGADGSLRRTAVVGDGVQHLRSTPTGEVWIGYSDQGIYGSLGWGRPGLAPVGHSGLVRFGTDLTLAWEFPRGDAPPRISDCDALNVDSDVWTCYYTDFPVARIDHDLVTTWPTGLVAVSALLVDQDRIASVGAQVTFAHIEGDDLRVTSTRPLILPPEAETPGTHLIGQGPSLHALTPSGDWYLADLDTLTTQSR
ncbi:MAG: hypothetical protein QOF82_1263, partial [Frankiales bacterium]|nr:hypothetical protein [Frankiales bacterium]